MTRKFPLLPAIRNVSPLLALLVVFAVVYLCFRLPATWTVGHWCRSIDVGTPAHDVIERANKEGLSVRRTENFVYVFRRNWTGQASCTVFVKDETVTRTTVDGS